MAKITVELIKELREKTQVGMMDCKKALIETEGDMEKAIEILRKKGAAVAAKRADYETNHGRIASFISDDFKIGCLVELNTETDFSANTDDVKEFTEQLAIHIVKENPTSVDALLDQTLKDKSITVKNYLDDLIAKITENIKVNKFTRFEIKENGVVNNYIHPGSTLATLVELQTDQEIEPDKVAGQRVLQLAHDICMQIAVTQPLCVEPSELDPKLLEKEKEIAREQLKASGKPENIIDKILEGKMKKYYAEVCLLDQPFIKDDKVTIKKHIDDVEKDTGFKITVKQFERFGIGKK